MSVIVKGMKMPDSCAVCRFAGRGGYFMERIVCMFTGENEDAENVDRLPNCPLVALPDKHGRLGDLDALIRDHFSPEHRIALSEANKAWMRRIINEAPTIVESEDSEC